MSTKLFVGNLPFTASDADLEAHFAQAGTVETVNVVRERDTGRNSNAAAGLSFTSGRA